MRHSAIVIAALLTATISATAQDTLHMGPNMVYNPSFEEYRQCPQRIDSRGTLTTVDAWYQPTAGSADYYNVCGRRECQVPNNKLGSQPARTGVGYCGIYCSQDNYREYLQTELREPLVPGATYEVTFHVSLAELSPEAVGTLGALFTSYRLADSSYNILLHREWRQVGPARQAIATNFTPQVCGAPDQPLTDTEQWQRVSGHFVAQGGERFLTIGNFAPASHSGLVSRGGDEAILRGAYYYIDDVSVRCLDCHQLPLAPKQTANHAENTATSTPQPPKVGETFVLDDIYFEFDRSTLLQQSYNALERLIALLERYPRLKIEIGGHTDGQGSERYNLRLSESRATAVRDYLVARGIDSRRLQAKGYGKSHPRATNATDEGRAFNRRVEVKVIANP